MASAPPQSKPTWKYLTHYLSAQSQRQLASYICPGYSCVRDQSILLTFTQHQPNYNPSQPPRSVHITDNFYAAQTHAHAAHYLEKLLGDAPVETLGQLTISFVVADSKPNYVVSGPSRPSIPFLHLSNEAVLHLLVRFVVTLLVLRPCLRALNSPLQSHIGFRLIRESALSNPSQPALLSLRLLVFQEPSGVVDPTQPFSALHTLLLYEQSNLNSVGALSLRDLTSFVHSPHVMRRALENLVAFCEERRQTTIRIPVNAVLTGTAGCQGTMFSFKTLTADQHGVSTERSFYLPMCFTQAIDPPSKAAASKLSLPVPSSSSSPSIPLKFPIPSSSSSAAARIPLPTVSAAPKAQ